MKLQDLLKPVMLFSCLLMSILSMFPTTLQASSIFFPNGQYYPGNQGDNRYRDRSSYNYRRQNRALNFYDRGSRNRRYYIDYNRDYDNYCPENSYSDYRDGNRRSYQRPRGFGFFYYGKQR